MTGTAGPPSQPRPGPPARGGNAVANQAPSASGEVPTRSLTSSPNTRSNVSSAATVSPADTQSASGTSTRVPAGAPSGAPAAMPRKSASRPSTRTSDTVIELPAVEVAGLFGQDRKTSSQVSRSGVNSTTSRPATVARSGATSKRRSTTGRSGHGSASSRPGAASPSTPEEIGRAHV